MAVIPHDCPHCGVKNISFDILHEYQHPSQKGMIYTFVKCAGCEEAAVAVFVQNGSEVSRGSFSFASHAQSCPKEVKLIAFYPSPESPDAPNHLPDNVLTFFNEAVANVKTGPTASVMMFRKCIEVALKIIAPELQGNLVQRIEEAAKKGRITSELAEWAHHIRLAGNDAAHDETPFTPDEAAELHKFTELLLMYFFTLPGMLKERKNIKADQ